MHRDAVAAVLRSTPHKWRTSEKLMSDAMAVHVAYRAKPLWTYHVNTPVINSGVTSVTYTTYIVNRWSMSHMES